MKTYALMFGYFIAFSLFSFSNSFILVIVLNLLQKSNVHDSSSIFELALWYQHISDNRIEIIYMLQVKTTKKKILGKCEKVFYV